MGRKATLKLKDQSVLGARAGKDFPANGNNI